jgi:histidinol-phosphate/aromatic aminotransferase/cobyric acid decarboxylase-like protein/adenosyl cobinamide kinase/adenosyl cobinamide phosphate guanylyltransferase
VGLTVVIGGTRSGKSTYAEALAVATGLPVRYVATADGADESLRERIAAHAARRPSDWTTVEAGASLAGAVAGANGHCVLVDGLGPWIATRLHEAGAFDDPERLNAARESVLAEVTRAVAATATARAAIVVAEQAGEGLLPPDAGSRAWLDLLGEATQRFTAAAEIAILVVAGRPIALGAAAPPGAPAGTVGVATFAGPETAYGEITASRGDGVEGPSASVETRSLGAVSLRSHGDRMVQPGDADHAVNVVAGGPPPWLRAALDAALEGVASAYPREDEAIAALAALHERDPAEVVPTNGAAEALWLLGPALRPSLAACVHPGFTETEASLHAHGVPVVRVLRDPDRGFALDPEAVPEDADLVVVGNPASPSGTLDPAEAILALRRPGRTVVVDEAFMDLVPGEPGSLARTAPEDVIVVRSLTKVLAIPGLRAGYALAAPALAQRIRDVRPPWSANALALAALIASAEHPEEVAAIARRTDAERADLQERLRAIPGVRVWPGAANFVLIAVPDGVALASALRAARIAVRPAASFPGLDDRYIRITARTPEENARVAAAIAAALEVA